MPVKLNKVLKDLNVGLQTVVDFLHAKGCEIESNPNVRIQDDQYALLVKEFGKNLSEAERRRLLEKAAPKAPIVKESSQKEKEKKEEKPKKEPEVIKTEIPDEIKPKFVTKGKIDLSGIGEPKKEGTKRTKKEEKEEGAPSVASVEETKKVEEVQQPEPVQVPEPEVVPPSAPSVEVQEVSTPEPHSAEEPVESKKEEPAVTTQAEEKTVEALPEQRESESAPKQEEEIFRLGQPKLESTIKVTGKIDLASLNQSMRPKKKSKEERRKEREEKRKQQTPADNKQKSGTGSVNAANAASTTGESGKKKRKRIKKDKIDINATVGTNTRRDDHGRGHDHGGKRLKKPVRAEISEEAVQKQVKETLARLTSKGGKSKGAKYRREKRDAVAHREQELHYQVAATAQPHDDYRRCRNNRCFR